MQGRPQNVPRAQGQGWIETETEGQAGIETGTEGQKEIVGTASRGTETGTEGQGWIETETRVQAGIGMAGMARMRVQAKAGVRTRGTVLNRKSIS